MFLDIQLSGENGFDLLKNERYSAACVQITRGCPYRCEYCDVPTKNGGFRAIGFGKTNPIDLVRWQVANCYLGRAGLINSDGTLTEG